jgi:STE24 endopeptidase
MDSLFPAQTLAVGLAALFAALVAVDGCIKLWLASRQTRHVLAHRSAVPAAFSEQIALAAHQKAADYTAAKMQLATIEIPLAALLLLGWTLLGGLDALNKLVVGEFGSSITSQIALIVAFSLIGSLIDLPFSWWRTFRLEAKFGFNRTDLKTWLLDGLKGLVIGAAIGLPLLWVVLSLMAKAGALWWLYAWGVWASFVLALMVIYPTLIAPLFNKFAPLDDAALKTRVEALLARTGFAVKGLFVMDGSKRSAHANAYFTGLGKSKRVVFFDTLLAMLKPEEIEAVLAHELGHFKHRHITKRLVWMLLTALGGLALLGYLSQKPWFFFGLGVAPNMQGGNEALALLLFMLAVPVFMFMFEPLGAYFSRKHEFEADAFAASTSSSTDLSNALVKMYQDNASTLTPDPLFVKWYYSHPPAAERLSHLQRLNVSPAIAPQPAAAT